MWPAPEISLDLDEAVDADAVQDAAGVHIPHASIALGPRHEILVRRGPAQLEVSDQRTVVSIQDPRAIAPQAISLLAAGRAAAGREYAGAVTLRAAALVRSGAALLLVGPALAGKTSVALRMRRDGWSFVASNTALVSREGRLLGGSRKVTVRDAARGGRNGEPFRLHHADWLVALPAPVPLRAVVFVASAPGDALARPLAEPELELFNAACELPRLCIVLVDELIDVGLDCACRARARHEICTGIAATVPTLRVTGSADGVAAWASREWPGEPQ